MILCGVVLALLPLLCALSASMDVCVVGYCVVLYDTLSVVCVCFIVCCVI